MPALRDIFFGNEGFLKERVTHSLKTALACLIGFVFIKWINFPSAQWLIITILVVMCAQLNVGGMLHKSYMRLMGTFIGSILAIATIYFFGNDFVPSILVITFSAFIFSYLATSSSRFSDAGTLGAVTVTIILISHDSTTITGFERFFEISLGIFVATFVSQFILPAHASEHLYHSQAATMRELKKYYIEFFVKQTPSEFSETNLELDEQIVKSIVVQRKLATEARRELFGEKFNMDYFQRSLWAEKEILRSIFIMHLAFNKSDSSKKIIAGIPTLATFHENICKVFESLAVSLEKKKPHEMILPDLQALKVEFYKAMQSSPPEDQVNIGAYLLCMEVLLRCLTNLIQNKTS